MRNGGDDGQDATTGLPGASARGEPGGLVGERIGPYRLVSLLGRGGMGEVYVAEQDVPVRRSVALKLLRARRLDARSLSHFEIERQLLAQMRHPAIAQIFDAGTTVDGRPYSAMELIEGQPITAYCSRERLPLRARLRLFTRVCEGVQHAHQKAVAHRDLKPSNILVAKVDGRALPKIIDFGIASMMSGGSSDGSGVMGTPAYMSPEQAETPHDIDTRSDIYSLGVLLHELLCGHRPARGDRHAYRPSETFAALPAADQARVAGEAGLEPRALLRMLTRELDWVVAKATAPDRALRYASATELAGDLLRFLDGQPLAAVPSSRVYRLKKFARRQRAGITAAAVVLLALVAGLGMSLYGLDRARTQQALAEERARQLETVSRFQQSMLEDIDLPGMAIGMVDGMRAQFESAPEEALVRLNGTLADVNATDVVRGLIDDSILASASAAVDRDFAGDPSVAADLRLSIARVRIALGMYDQAAVDLQEIVQTRERALGGDARQVLQARHALATALVRAGRPGDAKVELDRALSHAGALPPDDELRAELELSLSEAVGGLGDLAAARDMQATLHARLIEIMGERAPMTIRTLNNLGIATSRLGEKEAAHAIFTRLLALTEVEFGPEAEDTLRALGNLSNIEADLGNLDRSMALSRRLLDAHNRRFGARHPVALSTRSNMALDLMALGRLDEARAEHEDVLRLRSETLGPDHPQTLSTHWHLAAVHGQMGDFDIALRLGGDVVADYRRVLGEDHPTTRLTELKYARLFHQAGRPREASRLIDRALPSALKVFGERRGEVRDAIRIRDGLVADMRLGGQTAAR